MEPFFQRVYKTVKQIPKGEVATYGQIARYLEAPHHARMVGWALSKAPDDVPAHRVVKKDGILPPESVFLGVPQRELLEKEGVPFIKEEQVDLRKCSWFEYL
ncbi:methylated-DNA--protein-cysteine methyltransferase [Alkalihalobacillus alcalophilus ATCC 27647 = CGMCC 1.3604]|uniref:Cysteine methyltransferase n=1 Tax=Alkalihalobacillus alcalophilus ATCC 27647 = CGMCC 1.3604 TaxID=1218173 RepID=A0A094YS03_ALKAL|nr:MGMT family protein [Alkalihalobacillus alcalophilus]KGA96232.1 cysteine methyltransferase [Alkalihalobacillus alcalophilus ATCC 27647 = CGMCC 1.3604]MED1560731.1 MGMT family protein [Alkalihalobacillus alcalophilus]THG90678.1 methylated-DNA--protein-cysteine methyltransferase [Alkalihalobacillus alcalophilus ATCC 27647 = CGMCC 1.3604]